jgi:hypothetical protein
MRKHMSVNPPRFICIIPLALQLRDTRSADCPASPYGDDRLAVAAVIDGFRPALPDKKGRRDDAGSADEAAGVAVAACGAHRFEIRPGKGSVVWGMFAATRPNRCVIVDGGSSHDAFSLRRLPVHAIEGRNDVVKALCTRPSCQSAPARTPLRQSRPQRRD